ncbi:hypothetical protein [Streptomyces chartreusis]
MNDQNDPPVDLVQSCSGQATLRTIAVATSSDLSLWTTEVPSR